MPGNPSAPSDPSAPSAPSDPGASGDPPAPDDPGRDHAVAVTLHVNHSSVIGTSVVTSFGVPFPRGLVSDVSKLVVRDAGGRELPSHVEETVTWRTLGGSRSSDGSVRAALVYVEVELTQDSPIQIQLDYDGQRALELGSQPAASASWVEVRDDDFDIALREPPIYATLSPEWLEQCELRTMTTPAHSDTRWSWFDDFFVNSAYTATNDLPASITHAVARARGW